MAGKFVLKKTGKGKFTFRLQASNGQVILSSEAYESRNSALNGVKSVRRNAEKDSNFELMTSKSGKPYFVLRAANKEIIGQGEMYSRASGARKGIASVKANAATAVLEDLTA